MLPALARQAAERDLGGLEFGVGIPGTVGGALQTNAGIGDGRCIGDLVRSVEVLRDGRRVTVPREAITFAYRHTSLRGSGDVALGARLALTAAHGLEERGGKRALATLCVGVGQGLSLAIERI